MPEKRHNAEESAKCAEKLESILMLTGILMLQCSGDESDACIGKNLYIN